MSDLGFPYLINKKITVNGREIYCKVTGEPGSANDGEPYIVVVTGGPGFSHELTEAYMHPLIQIAREKNAKLPHFIFLDNLGCGKSDKATDKDQEYTVDNFTDLTVGLVEKVKAELGLKHMDLFAEGGSFGSLVAMNIPARKPEWLDANSDIHLRQITAKVVPQGADMKDYTMKFLAEHYANHPNYKKLVAAQNRLYAGDFKNNADYLKNFVLPIASLYIKDAREFAGRQFINNVLNKMINGLVNAFPNIVIKGIDLANRLSKKLNRPNEKLDLYDTLIGKCSLEVLNHFFGHNFSGFNLIDTVREHRDLYEKVPICMISAENDHVVDWRITHTINNETLPKSSAEIIFGNEHMLSVGPSRKIYEKLNYNLLVEGKMPANDLNYDAIVRHTVNDQFRNQIEHAHDKALSGVKVVGSTVDIFTTMPIQEHDNDPAYNPAPNNVVSHAPPTPTNSPSQNFSANNLPDMQTPSQCETPPGTPDLDNHQDDGFDRDEEDERQFRPYMSS